MEETNKNIDQNVVTDYMPKVGIEFGSEQEAYDFYNEYGRAYGFSIRKDWCNKRKVDGVVTSRQFVCCKQGFKVEWERDGQKTHERAETRTGCQAHMKIRLGKKNEKYYIHSFELNHNHALHVSQCAHMMPSQRKISQAHALEIDLAEDSGIKLKDSYELMGRQAGGRDVLGYTKQDQKNYLHSKRQRELKYGELGGLLKYFEKKKQENFSFYYALQLDAEEQITNIFWADAQMIIDYKLFGDVVSFDTTYRTNKEYRPLAMFVGFNHHREVVIFGAALLYDETIESFQWLFETFFESMSGKKPNTIFTNQDPAMANAISLVMPNTYHRLCTWHLIQNALKHIGHLFRAENGFRSDLHACFKVWEDEEELLIAWDAILHKYNVRENSWLQRLFEVKEKWAKAYVKMSFSAGINSTQLSESLNSGLKNYLQSDYDIVKFFTHFERLLNDKRYKELLAEYNLRQKLPKIKMSSPMLVEAAKIYTSRPFLKFQKQYEKFQGAYIKEHVERNSSHEYIVSFYDKPQDRRVIWNSLENDVSCSCRKFERCGILCGHALKILDVMNIKVLPEKYILKRWTKNARNEIVQDFNGHEIIIDTNLEVTNRYRSLCPMYVKLISRAVECEEAYNIALENYAELSKKIEDVMRMKSDLRQVDNSQENPLDEMAITSAKGIKKKQGCKGRRRIKSCTEVAKKKKKSINNLPPQSNQYIHVIILQLYIMFHIYTCYLFNMSFIY
jgi:zinc finger SWIM domain-containing protein 3